MPQAVNLTCVAAVGLRPPLNSYVRPQAVSAFVRILCGALIAYAFVWAAQFPIGLLAIWSPFPHSWWVDYPRWIILGSEALITVPGVIGLGFLLSKLYKRGALVSAFASVTLAVLLAYSDFFTDLKVLADTWQFSTPWLVGPPLATAVFDRLRSNNRWRGP